MSFTGKILVEGFCDAVRPLQDWERKTWARLPDADTALLEQTGVPALLGEEGFDSCERRWARPTIEINGMGSGYQGEGSKTVIGKEAMVKISCRPTCRIRTRTKSLQVGCRSPAQALPAFGKARNRPGPHPDVTT